MNREFNFQTMWHIIGAIVVLTVLAFCILWAFADKRVDGYYLSHARTTSAGTTCVYAHWTWHNDELAFCTDDYKKALEFVERANGTVKK